jgi:ADP-sugar diphosphatase
MSKQVMKSTCTRLSPYRSSTIRIANRPAFQFSRNISGHRPINEMSTFTIPADSDAGAGEIPVHSNSELTREQLLAFPAFKIWHSTLLRSMSLQRNPSHEFHQDSYRLRNIDIQAVDYFGRDRLGFIKFKAHVANDSGESLPGGVFLRGGSVAMLVSD